MMLEYVRRKFDSSQTFFLPASCYVRLCTTCRNKAQQRWMRFDQPVGIIWPGLKQAKGIIHANTLKRRFITCSGSRVPALNLPTSSPLTGATQGGFTKTKIKPRIRNAFQSIIVIYLQIPLHTEIWRICHFVFNNIYQHILFSKNILAELICCILTHYNSLRYVIHSSNIPTSYPGQPQAICILWRKQKWENAHNGGIVELFKCPIARKKWRQIICLWVL